MITLNDPPLTDEESGYFDPPEEPPHIDPATYSMRDLMDLARSLVDEIVDLGEDDDGSLLQERFRALEEAVPTKVERAGYVIRALEAHAGWISAEKKRLAAEEKRVRTHAAALKALAGELVMSMEPLSGSKTLQLASGRASAIVSTRVVGPDNVFDWPEELRVARDPTPNRSKAALEMKCGRSFPGISLETHYSVKFA